MASSASIDTPNKASTLPRKVSAILENSTKGQVKESFFKGLAYMTISVLGGGLLTAVIGKPAFIIGAGLTVIGYYKDNRWLPPLGLGMMASSTLIPNEGVTGVSGFSLKQETENAKNRLISFKDSLLSKTYIDKVIKPKASSTSNRTSVLEETTNGFGSVNDNLNVLNQIEQQLVSSAMAIQNQRKSQDTRGVRDEISDFNEEDFSGF